MALVAHKVGVCMVPGFSMATLSYSIEPFRVANRVRRRDVYEWCLISAEDRPVPSSSGFILWPYQSIDQVDDFSLVLVVSSSDSLNYRNSRFFNWLRRLARTDCRLGALDCGTFLLARAGLLDGYRCAVPWQQSQEFSEQFPRVEITNDLYSIDRNRLTGAGATAALDLMLALIAEQQGRQIAAEVAQDFLHTRIRSPREGQRMEVQWRYGITDERLVKCITLMERNIEHPVSNLVLARSVVISLRQLERLFKKAFGCSPSRFYLRLRLSHARTLLTESTDTILGIALRSGFSDASHLGKCYREVFHETPGRVRRSRHAA